MLTFLNIVFCCSKTFCLSDIDHFLGFLEHEWSLQTLRLLSIPTYPFDMLKSLRRASALLRSNPKTLNNQLENLKSKSPPIASVFIYPLAASMYTEKLLAWANMGFGRNTCLQGMFCVSCFRDYTCWTIDIKHQCECHKTFHLLEYIHTILKSVYIHMNFSH